MPMEYIMSSLCIASLTDMAHHDTMEEHLTQLMELEQDQFLAGFPLQMKKEHEKAWDD